MNNNIGQCLDEVQSFLSADFTRQMVNEAHYELSNGKSLLKFFFDRFDTSKVVVLVCDPTNPDDDGMKLLILRHLLHAKERMRAGESVFSFIGRTLESDCAIVLRGDFAVRREYDMVEPEFFNYIDDVMSLPSNAPARQLFEDCDIRWLNHFREKYI